MSFAALAQRFGDVAVDVFASGETITVRRYDSIATITGGTARDLSSYTDYTVSAAHVSITEKDLVFENVKPSDRVVLAKRTDASGNAFAPEPDDQVVISGQTFAVVEIVEPALGTAPPFHRVILRAA